MSPKWFRSKCIKSAVTVLLSFAATAAYAVAPTAKSSPRAMTSTIPMDTVRIQAKNKRSVIPQALKQVEANYAKAGTIYAHFEQDSYSSVMHSTKPSSGDIVIKRPNKLRWQTLQPDPSLLVSDGRKAWFYTPPFDPSEQGQYTEVPASQIRSKLANALLSGEFSESSGLVIQAVSDREFVLKPHAGTAGSVVEARVEIDPKSKTITRVKLTHSDGNQADIHLSGIKLGQKYDDSTFVFKAPPNTVKVDE